MGYYPLTLADKTYLFKKNNVYVDVNTFSSTTEVLQAMKEGDIQGACLTLDEVLSLIESGIHGKVVLIIDYSMGGDMIVGQKNIESIEELEGKTIGYEGTVVGEFVLERALYLNHIIKSRVHLIDIPVENWISSFNEKKVDALVCFDPFATTLLKEENGNLLFSSTEIPFEIIDVLFFTEAFYDNNKTAITNIVKSWFDALLYLETNTEEAIQIISSAKNIYPDDYKQGLKGIVAPGLEVNKVVFNSKLDKNIYKYSQVIIDFMIAKGLLSKRINTNDIFQSEILYEIDKE